VLEKLLVHRSVCTNPATDTAHSRVSMFNNRNNDMDTPAFGRVGLAGQKPYRTKDAASDSQSQKVMFIKCRRPKGCNKNNCVIKIYN